MSALLFVAFERFILSLASVSNGPKTNIALKMKGLLVLGNIRNYNPQDKITSQRLESPDTILLSFPNSEDTSQIENSPELTE